MAHVLASRTSTLLAAFTLLIGCGKGELPAPAAAEPTAPASAPEPAKSEPPTAANPNTPASTREPAKAQPAAEAASDAPTTPTTKVTSAMCKNLDHWTLTKRYALSRCKNALQDGCDETLGMMIASVERSLTTSPERLRAAGGSMANLLGVMGDQIDNAVLKPADAALQDIRAYTPTDAEKEVHTTLVGDYGAFIALSKRWSKSLHKYHGDVGTLADLQTETENAETKAMVHEIRCRSLCNGTAK